MEIVLTFGLVNVILGTASGAQNVGLFGALGVGAYIALAGLWGSPISGTSMNPARTFGPDLVGADFTAYWVYIVGPIAGAVVAVGTAFILHGRGGGRAGSAAGQGTLPRRDRPPRASLSAFTLDVTAASRRDTERRVDVPQGKVSAGGRWRSRSSY